MTTNVCFHTFMPPSHRSNKIIIINLNHTTLISDKIDALSQLGHSARRVVNVNKNGLQFPLFFVDLEPDTNNIEILYLSSMLNMKIKVELPIPYSWYTI